MLILNKNNEISDLAFYSLGQMTGDEVREILSAVISEETIEVGTRRLDYEDALGITFRLLAACDYYTDSDGDGIWSSIKDDKDALALRVGSGLELRISGIIRPKEDATATAMTGISATRTS